MIVCPHFLPDSDLIRPALELDFASLCQWSVFLPAESDSIPSPLENNAKKHFKKQKVFISGDPLFDLQCLATVKGAEMFWNHFQMFLHYKDGQQ